MYLIIPRIKEGENGMITLVKDDTKKELDLMGKSTDTKPTGSFEGLKLTNGSTFFEMDTQNVYFYDQDVEDWLDQP